MLTNPLVHYSMNAPLDIPNLNNISQWKYANDKPRGLWISVEDGYGWKDWCDAENYRYFGELKNEIILKPDAKILHLTSAKEILIFSEHYGAPYPHLPEHLTHKTACIKWEEVAKKYQGIIIAPYCWELRLTNETQWYYGWDCSSGCIWNPDAIGEIKCAS